jgi:hypothetical protein
MIEICKSYGAKTLRLFVEDGAVLISARDIGTLINDKNPSRRLERAGVLSSRYRLADTNGGVHIRSAIKVVCDRLGDDKHNRPDIVAHIHECFRLGDDNSYLDVSRTWVIRR